MAGMLPTLGLSKMRTLSNTIWRGLNTPWYYTKPLITSSSIETDIRHKFQLSHPDSGDMKKYPLEHKEAMSFLCETLHIKNIYWKLRHDKVGLLNEVLKRVKHGVPITNLTLISLLNNDSLADNEEMCLQQMKEDMLSLQGGQCNWFGLFLQALLSQFGYDIHLVGAGDMAIDVMYDMHPALIVHDVTYDGSLHLLEASPTYPIFQVIPLNFSGESLVHKFANVKRKFIKDGKGILKYCHLLEQGQLPTSNLREIIEEDGRLWQVRMTYRYTSTRTESHFFDVIVYLRLAPSLGSFYHKNILVNGFSGGGWVSVTNHKVTIRDMQGVHLNTFEVSSLSKVKDVILKYFPQYPPSLVDKCIAHVEESRINMK